MREGKRGIWALGQCLYTKEVSLLDLQNRACQTKQRKPPPRTLTRIRIFAHLPEVTQVSVG